MRGFGVIASEAGQATVELLAILPLIVATAVGLGSAGIWLSHKHTAESVAASKAVELLEGGSSESRREVVTEVGAGRKIFGVNLAETARLRWEAK